MNIMSFVDQAAGKLGVSSVDAGTAVSGVLGLIQDKASADDAASLMQAIPGASDLLGARKAEAAQGGGLGGMLGSVGGLLGGKAGSALSVMSIFQNANMDTGQAGSLVQMLVGYLQENAGQELIGRILEQVPDLKKFV